MELFHHKQIAVSVRSIDGDRALLVLPDGQILRWPLAQLPADVKAGDTIALQATASAAPAASGDPADMHALAHAVLNKIFSAGDAEIAGS